MSVKDALDFIQHVEKDGKLKDKIRKLGEYADLEEITKIGGEEGFGFTVEELRIAFARDWDVRRRFYSLKNDK